MASRRMRLAAALLALLMLLLTGCRDGPADKTRGENSRYGSQTATPSNGRT